MADANITLETKIDNKNFEKSVASLSKSFDSMRVSAESAAKVTSDTFGSKNQSKVEAMATKLMKQVDAAEKAKNEVSKLRNEYESLMSKNVEPKSLVAMQKELERVSKSTEKELINNDKLIAKYSEIAGKLETINAIKKGGYDISANVEYSTLKGELSELGNAIDTSSAKISEANSRAEMLKNSISELRMSPESSVEANNLSMAIGEAENKMARLSMEASITDKNMKVAMDVKEPSAWKMAIDSAAKSSKILAATIGGISMVSKGISSIYNRVSNSISGAVKSSSQLTKGTKDIGKEANKTSGIITKMTNRMKRIATAVLFYNVIRSAFRGISNHIKDLIKDNDSLSNSLTMIKFNLQTAFQPIWNAILPGLEMLMSALSRATAVFAQFMSAVFGDSYSSSQKAVKSLDAQKDSLDKVGKSAKKAGKQIQGFDQLNKMQEKDDTGSSGGKGKSQFKNIVPPKKDLKLAKAFEKVINNIKKALKPTTKALKELWDKGLKPLGKFVWTALEDFWKNFLKPVGKWVLGEGLPRLITALKDMLANVDWDKLNGALERMWIALEPLAIMVGEGLLWFWENVLMPLTGWAMENLIPAAVDLITEAVGLLSVLIEGAMPALGWLWESFFKPLGEWAGETIVNLIKGLTDKLRDFSEWAKENQTAVDLMVFTILGFFAGIMFYKGLVGTLNLITGAITLFGSASFIAGGQIALIGAAIGVLVWAIYKISQVWDQLSAGEKILSALGAAAMAAAIAIAIFHTSWTLGTAAVAIGLGIGGLIAVFAGINGKLGSMTKTPNVAAFSNMKPNENESASTPAAATNFMGVLKAGPKLPALAKGGLIPPRRPRQVIVGDNTVEDEIVSPISTMKDAFKDAIGELGGLGGFVGSDPMLLSKLDELIKLYREGMTIEMDQREFGRAVTASSNNFKGKTGQLQL